MSRKRPSRLRKDLEAARARVNTLIGVLNRTKPNGDGDSAMSARRRSVNCKHCCATIKLRTSTFGRGVRQQDSVIAAVAAIGLPQSQGEHVGVNGRASRCVRRFAARLARIQGTDASLVAAGGEPARMASVVAVVDRR